MRLLDGSSGPEGSACVVIGPEEVERNVRLIPNHPTVVRDRWYVEQLASL